MGKSFGLMKRSVEAFRKGVQAAVEKAIEAVNRDRLTLMRVFSTG